MHHFIIKKITNIWKVIDHTSRAFIGRICGDRSTKILLKFSKKNNILKAKRVVTDKYACYAKVIGSRSLRQGKANTYQVEQNNFLQRHWLARFHRRTYVVSRSQEMVDMSLALFARFSVSGSINELLSLLK